MEAPTVVLITKTLGTNETAVRSLDANIKLRLVQLFVTVLIWKVRSGMLRAVAKLVVITDVRDTNVEMVKKYFEVVNKTSSWKDKILED